jgi:hypothetical protein
MEALEVALKVIAVGTILGALVCVHRMQQEVCLLRSDLKRMTASMRQLLEGQGDDSTP